MFLLSLLLLGLCLLINVSLGGYIGLGCKEESGFSEYDKPDTWYGGWGYWINGMDSYHSNKKEDRKFKMTYCRPSTSSYRGRVSYQTLPYTDYDDSWIRGCGGSSAIWKVYSKHSNKKEDRTFEFKCANIDEDLQFGSCEWRGYYPSSWDQRIHFTCPNKGIIRTIESYHSNKKEDRKYKFECCRLKESEVSLLEMNCQENDFYTNEWDKSHDNLKAGWFLNGKYSTHSNKKEDRRFKWRYCKQEDVGDDGYGYVSTEDLDETGYDDTWTRSCSGYNNGHAAMIRAYSYHSNKKEDRRWTYRCGLLDTSKYSLSNCAYTGHLNTWDDDVNFDCPNDGVIRSIWSKHSNKKEDRLWKFECCNVVEADYSFSNIEGFWRLVVSLDGAGTISTTLSVGVETSNSQEVTDTYASSLSVAVAAGYEYMGASGSVEVTGTVSQETSNTVSSSFTEWVEEAITVECGENVQYLYQFIITTDQNEVDTQQYRCTNIAYPACGPGFYDCANGDPNCNTCKSDWPTN